MNNAYFVGFIGEFPMWCIEARTPEKAISFVSKQFGIDTDCLRAIKET